MKHTVHPIANIVKDSVLDAIQTARKSLRFVARPKLSVGSEAITKATARREKATAAVSVLDWANNLVVTDQHDPLLALRFANVIADLLDLAEGEHSPEGFKATASRLRLASLLLFSARRERDLQGRLDAILPTAYEANAVAEGLCDLDAPNPRTGADRHMDLAGLALQTRTIAQLARS